MSVAVKFNCDYCGAPASTSASAFNRATREFKSLYCNRVCSGLGRRKHKTVEQKKAEKSAYDAARRVALADQIKAAKRAYHKRTYDPVKAAEQRKATMARHIEYCRRPEYREWKRGYDRQYRAKVEYGEFWECFLLTMDIREEALRLSSDYEIRLENGTLTKSQKRKRTYERTRNFGPDRQEHEGRSLGDLKLRQERGDAAGAS